jgi:glycine cleavage system transcriptional repressor
MSCSFIVSIFAKDRVGIIADVTKAMLNLDGDLGDLSQAVLDGYFTMIFVAEFKNKIERSVLKNKILKNFVEDEEFVSIVIKDLEGNTSSNCFDDLDSEKNRYVMTATAENRKGLVAEVADFCKKNQINILYLATTLSEDTYIMMYLIDLSAVTFLDVLREKTKEFADEKNMQIVLQHNDIFKATNEIKYYK